MCPPISRHILEIHQLVRSSKTVLGRFPISLNSNLWPPTDNFFQFLLQFSFQCICNKPTNSRHLHSTIPRPTNSNHERSILRVSVNQKSTINGIGIPADTSKGKRPISKMRHSITQEIPSSCFSFKWNLLLGKWYAPLLTLMIGIRHKVAVPWMLIADLELVFLFIGFHEEPFCNVKQDRKIPVFLRFLGRHSNMAQSPSRRTQ